MSVTVGTLVVDLVANTSSFVSGLDKAGQIALTSQRNIGRAMTALATSMAAGFAAVEAGLAAMIESAVSNAARLEDMAQSTGTSVAALSALEYAAKQSGVSTESLDRSLEKMSKSMLKAAEGGSTATNAYKTLGVAVKAADGTLRPTQDVLADLAQKFSTFKDGPEKTALAMQIFGRSGAELVPLLNRGKEGITDLMAEAKKLGVVIDDDTAAAAKHFEQSMNKLKAAAQGAALSVAKDALPYLNSVLDNISANAQQDGDVFKGLVNIAGDVAQAFVINFSRLQTFLKDFGDLVAVTLTNMVIGVDGVGNTISAALAGDWKGVKNAFHDMNVALDRENTDYAARSTERWKESARAVTDYLNSTDAKVTNRPKPTGTAPKITTEESSKYAQTIADRISKLQAAADAEAHLAAAQKGSTAATVEATAAAEANKIVEELNTAAHTHKAAALTAAQKAQVLSATTEKAFATVANELSKTLADETTKLDEQATATKEMAAAYAEGGAAIQTAQERAKIAPFAEKVALLQGEFVKLVASGTASSVAIRKMALDVANANTQYENAAKGIHEFNVQQQQSNSNKELTDISRQISAVQNYTIALMGGARAMREFNIDQQVLAYTRNPAMDQSADAVARYRTSLQQLQGAELTRSAAEKVASLANLSNIQDEINELEKFRETNALSAQEQLAYDVLIHDAEQKKLHDMDAMLLKVGGVSAGFKAWLDSYLNDGVSTAQKVYDVMTLTMNGFTDNLAKALTSGKANWSDFINTILADLEKLALNQIFKSLLNLGLGIFGGGGGGGDVPSMSYSTFSAGGGSFGGGKAEGGPVNPGTLYQVGERGREFFQPTVPGVIIPNSQTKLIPGSNGQQPVVIYQNFDIKTPSPDSFRMSQDQIAAKAWSAAGRAAQRNGR